MRKHSFFLLFEVLNQKFFKIFCFFKIREERSDDPPRGGADERSGATTGSGRPHAAPAAPIGGHTPPEEGGGGTPQPNDTKQRTQGAGELPHPHRKRRQHRLRTDSAEKEDWKLIQKLLTPPNALAAQIALKTGLRISDVLSIKTDQLKQRQFTVTEQKTKKKRRIFLNESLKEALRAQAGETFVFEHAHDPERHRTRQAVYKDIKRAAKALRLDGNIAPHSARKTYAVDYYRKHGLAATQKKLGHRFPSTTLIYLLSELSK